VTHENDPHGRPQVRQARRHRLRRLAIRRAGLARGLALPLRLRQYDDLDRRTFAGWIKHIMRLPSPGAIKERGETPTLSQ
jgi:hypothetical protein